MPAHQTKPDVVGTAEAARLLGVDKSTITRWVSSGALRTTGRLSGRNGAYLFDRADVERLARERAA